MGEQHATYLEALRCPVCGAEMAEDATSGAGVLYCRGAKKHTFDRARSGYVHLAPRHSGGGDAKEAVRARTAFLSAGQRAISLFTRAYRTRSPLSVNSDGSGLSPRKTAAEFLRRITSANRRYRPSGRPNRLHTILRARTACI